MTSRKKYTVNHIDFCTPEEMGYKIKIKKVSYQNTKNSFLYMYEWDLYDNKTDRYIDTEVTKFVLPKRGGKYIKYMGAPKDTKGFVEYWEMPFYMIKENFYKALKYYESKVDF